MSVLDQLSDALAERVAATSALAVAIRTGHRHASGILWRPDVVVTSEQTLPDQPDFTVLRGGTEVAAKLAGRDPGTNIALLKLAQTLDGTLPAPAPTPRVGALAVLLGADATGAATARLGVVHAVGAEWHSLRGGRIDLLLRLDARLGPDEGGPVLLGPHLLGMSTAGPRRRTLVIPTATIARIIDPLLAEGRIARGWLGVGLQPVAVPDSLRHAAGCDCGMIVMSLASGAPAAQAGVLPGDIVLDIDGTPARRMRALAALLGPERIGQTLTLRLLRAGTVQTVGVPIAARPAG
ncbi:MAG TPA: S1C family serine protease [Acetobacteraceae bacterium]|nr:S1C family serine protease [Acetobacteraceae bacterium]